VSAHAGTIATMIVVWVAGLAGILVTTAPEEARAVWQWSTRPRRRRPLRGFHPRAYADAVRGGPGVRGDVVDSRHVNDPHPVVRHRGPLAQQHPIDPAVEQAAMVLAKAMVTSRDRDRLWEDFREIVVGTAAELEEAPARDAVDEMERRGLKLDVVARVVQQRLGQ
jgi:hypothetical protein